MLAGLNMDVSGESPSLQYKIQELFLALNQALLASMLSAVVLYFVMLPSADVLVLNIWFSSFVLVSLARFYSQYLFKRADNTVLNNKLWFSVFFAGSLSAALVWGGASVFLFPDDDLAREIFLAFVVGGLAAGSLTSLSHLKITIYSFLIISMLPLIIQFYFNAAEHGNEMAGLLMLTLAMLLYSAYRMHLKLNQIIDLKVSCIEYSLSLNESERKNEILLQTATDAFFLVDENDNIAEVNLAASQQLGYSREELLSMSANDLVVLPDRSERISLYKSIGSEKTEQTEGIHRRKDGSTYFFEARLNKIQLDKTPMFSVMVRDITDRKKSEAEMQQSQQRMALHVQRTPLGVIEWDLDFCVTQWNPAAETIFGYTENEAIGKHASELVIPDGQLEYVNQVWQDLLNQRDGFRSTNENVTKNKHTILCDWYNTPLIDNQGRVIGVASLVDDITTQKRSELALIKAKEEAELASKAKSEFLSHMSHELRTPMTAIIGFSQIMSSSIGLDIKYRKFSQDILKAGNHLLALINDVLDLSSIESGKLKCNLQACDLIVLLSECLQVVEALASQYDIEIINHVNKNDTRILYTDPVRFKQALINLLSNAIKYNNENGRVTIDIVNHDNQTTTVSVTDTGIGLSKEEQDKLFTPFERFGEYKGIDGTGIGLVITKHLIEMMNGYVSVSSEKGEGSVFSLTIPQLNQTELMGNTGH